MTKKEEEYREERFFLYKVLENNSKIENDNFLKNIIERLRELDDLIQLKK